MPAMIQEQMKLIGKMLYPNVASPPLPASLPLENYEGSFEQPAYGIVHISVIDGQLNGTIPGRCTFDFRLDHVSGDYFTLISTTLWAPLGVRAQFEVSVHGTVKKFGAQFEGDESDGPRIWFVKK